MSGRFLDTPGAAAKDRGRRPRSAGLCAIFFALLFGFFAMSTFAQGERASERNLERSVKAAFLYKFAGYVEWPANMMPAADTPIVIGVAHEPALADELERIVPGRRIDNHPISVRRVKEGESLGGIHILFIGGADRARASALLRAAQSHAMLVVTELENGLALGSGINFVLIDGRVRFEAAPETAEKSGLKLSSRLLSVASNARGGSSP